MRLSQTVRAVFLLTLCLASSRMPTTAQVPTRPSENSDVVRINAELVQTEVSVLDSKGRFVDGLAADQFELRVDGKPVPVSFFERVNPVRPEKSRAVTKQTKINSASAHPRNIVYFIDDLHMSALSVDTVRKGLLHFVENEMRPDDHVAIVSASGQIGFLEQFTDQRGVLRAAVSRIKPQPLTIQDSENIAMSEYVALRIAEGDRATMTFYVNELLRSLQFQYALPKYGGKGAGFLVGSEADQAERMVLRRAESIIAQSIPRTVAALSALEKFLGSTGNLPGRKTVFFVSDGFLMHSRSGQLNRKLRDVTNSAALANAVFYPVDAQTFTGRSQSTFMQLDTLGRSDRYTSGQNTAMRMAMATLAETTGGRTLFETSTFDSSVDQGLEESNNYYLLAWQPETEAQRINRFKNLAVNVVGRPDLKVMLSRNHSFVARTDIAEKKTVSPTTNSDGVAGAVAGGVGNLPTYLSLSFLNTPNNGNVLTVATELLLGADTAAGDSKRAEFDLGGLVLNQHGKVVDSFKTRLEVHPLAAQQDNPSVIYNYRVSLPTGIYQVRVAAQNSGGSRFGRATQWIEISDSAGGPMSLSSLLLNSSVIESKDGDNAPKVQPTVIRRFPTRSRLSFLVFVYNASGVNTERTRPALMADIRVTQYGRTILFIPSLNVPHEEGSDLQRIPFGGTFPLPSLPSGRYFLEVTIKNPHTQASARQHIDFEVE